ncbi:Hypothetical predicted protein [Pelobates cultripes]|uniref:Uncharacterized protein n=1 Tax=Pelobates cultripes TaxID=61616 RepID=A0AAD1VL71_PELCU|nr:Hypothetical predicted protein [Pelobates cultripes]
MVPQRDLRFEAGTRERGAASMRPVEGTLGPVGYWTWWLGISLAVGEVCAVVPAGDFTQL